MKKTYKRIIILRMIYIIIVIGIVFFSVKAIQNKQIEIVDVISLVLAAASVIAVIKQLSDTRKIQEAEFIFNLNQSFVENETYAKVYTALEREFLYDEEVDITRIEISNYLTFFETIYLLLEEKVISIRVLDDLFAYRFFLAVHGEKIQKEKLVGNPYNFRNIYFLEKKWMNYRNKKGYKIFREDKCLENACIEAGKQEIYNKILGKKC